MSPDDRLRLRVTDCPRQAMRGLFQRHLPERHSTQPSISHLHHEHPCRTPPRNFSTSPVVCWKASSGAIGSTYQEPVRSDDDRLRARGPRPPGRKGWISIASTSIWAAGRGRTMSRWSLRTCGMMGDVGVVNYVRLVQRLGGDGKPITGRSEETRIWQRVDGQWRHVHFHRSV